MLLAFLMQELKGQNVSADGSEVEVGRVYLVKNAKKTVVERGIDEVESPGDSERRLSMRDPIPSKSSPHLMEFPNSSNPCL